MKIAFVAFDDLTFLDLIGIYDSVVRLGSMGFVPTLSWDICAQTPEIRDDHGLKFLATRVGGSLAGFDLVIVPGGRGTRKLMHDELWLAWLATAERVPIRASVCTGSLLFGALGWLKGRRATTHWGAYDELRPFCAEVVKERWVDNGDILTAGGVTSGIDLGLHLVERLAGSDARDRIAKQMDLPEGGLK